MAINAKVVFFFNYSQWGWTETYYYNRSTGGIPEAETAAFNLAAARRPLLSNNANLVAVRVSDMGSKESSTLNFSGFGNQYNSALPGQEPWQSLLCLAYAKDTPGNIYHRTLMLRGLPLAWNGWSSTDSVTSIFSPALLQALSGFFTVLTTINANIGGTWCIRAAGLANALNVQIPVQSVALVQPGSFYSVQVSPGATPTFAFGQKIHLSKFKGYAIGGLLGDHYINVPPVAGLYTLSARQCGAPSPPIITTPGVIYGKNTALLPIYYAAPERFVKRDTGRAFFGTRGRASSRAC